MCTSTEQMTVNQEKATCFSMQVYILLLKPPFILYLWTDTLYPQSCLGKQAFILPAESFPAS